VEIAHIACDFDTTTAADDDDDDDEWSHGP
jgi:hypothetical protein